jgi:ankyrin repeat protein
MIDDDGTEFTALMLAGQYGRIHAVHFLLDIGANPNIQRAGSPRGLQAAQVVEGVINERLLPEERAEQLERVARGKLFLACMDPSDNVEALQSIYEAEGIDLNGGCASFVQHFHDDSICIFAVTIPDIDGNTITPLLWAVKAGNEKVVRWMLQNGANPQIGDVSPLEEAHHLGHPIIINMLTTAAEHYYHEAQDDHFSLKGGGNSSQRSASSISIEEMERRARGNTVDLHLGEAPVPGAPPVPGTTLAKQNSLRSLGISTPRIRRVDTT